VNTLIIKLNATGDVVRTTTLLRILSGNVTWITAPLNIPLLRGLFPNLSVLSLDSAEATCLKDKHFDLVISLEDDPETAKILHGLSIGRLFGSFLGNDGTMRYTDDSRAWFDLSMISRFGKDKADQLKYVNRRTYQDLLFEGLGFRFTGQSYCLPNDTPPGIIGDVAIAPTAGPVWPMKNWAHYNRLKVELETHGYKVNILPRRSSFHEHIGDIQGHRCLVGGDSLPMHLALGCKIPCVTIFTCTSPWEIHGYDIQTQIISPLIGDFFYKRHYDERATTAVPFSTVFDAVLQRLKK
jgi:ADP-heptose:LPS heptosyltransferase